jgi:hypothetical protein
MTDSKSVAGAITYGSQAIAHDGFDVETFAQAADDYARLARTVEEARLSRYSPVPKHSTNWRRFRRMMNDPKS